MLVVPAAKGCARTGLSSIHKIRLAHSRMLSVIRNASSWGTGEVYWCSATSRLISLTAISPLSMALRETKLGALPT